MIGSGKVVPSRWARPLITDPRMMVLGGGFSRSAGVDYAVDHLDEQLFTPDSGPLPVTR
ncbi:hypothetical protein GCM10020220_068210 [Nonomuraea rubra]